MNEMPKKRGRPRKVKPELQVKKAPIETRSPREIEDFIQEANEVRQLTTLRGWGILLRDLNNYRMAVMSKLAYINPNRPEYSEYRMLFLAADKIISMVEDYEVNRDKSIELLNKLQNQDITVTMDVDNEI